MNNSIQIANEKQASSFEEAFFNSLETFIHPTAVVGPQVQLGINVKIGPFSVIIGNTVIGDNTRVHAHNTIGFPGQVHNLKKSLGSVIIGKNCEIREFVTIHASRYEEGATRIGNNCYLMNFSHVSHDALLEDNVTLINNVSLGGHTHVEKNAIIMANSATHQFCRVGQFTALAPFSAIRQDLPPFCLFSGQPGKFYGLNTIGLKRAGITSASINALKHLTKLFYQDKLQMDTICAQANLEPWGQDALVQVFITFVKNNVRGISRKSASDSISHREEECASL